MRVDEIERYLSKEMSPVERSLFEKEMEVNPSLKFDMQLITCVIRTVREEGLKRDRELVTRMIAGKSDDRKKYVTTSCVLFVSTVAMVAGLFLGIRYLVSYNKSETDSSLGTTGGIMEKVERETSVDFNYPTQQDRVDGDRLFPQKINSSNTIIQEGGNQIKKDNTGRETSQGVKSSPVPFNDPNDIRENTSLESTSTMVRQDDGISEGKVPQHGNKATETEEYLATVITSNGIWGAVKRAFMADKKMLQVDIVLNSRNQNVDIDEETFRFKTCVITDTGKRKSLYDFRYGNTNRTSFYLERNHTTHVSLYFKNIKNVPSVLNELRIPAIHQEFVFKSISIN